MEREDDRSWRDERPRDVEPSRELEAVRRDEMLEPWYDQARQVDARMWRARQSACGAPDLVDDPDVRRTHRRSARHEREATAVAAPSRTGNAFRGDSDSGPRAGRKIHHLELAPAGNVPDQRGPLAIVGVRDLLELRVVALREYVDPPGPVHRNPGERVPLSLGVRPAEHPAVTKASFPVLRLAVVRRQTRLEGRAAIDEIHVAVAAREDAEEEHRARGVVVYPRDPARSRDRLAPRTALEVDGERIPVRRVVPARGNEERSAVRAPGRERVVLLAPRRQPPQVRAIGTHDVDLRVEPSAGRDDQRDAVAARRPLETDNLIFERTDAIRPTSLDCNGPGLRDSRDIRDEGDAIAIRGEARPDAVADLREEPDLPLEVVRRRRSAGHDGLRHAPILHPLGNTRPTGRSHHRELARLLRRCCACDRVPLP